MFPKGDLVNQGSVKMRYWLTAKNNMLKLIGFGAAAALTFRFMYSSDASSMMLHAKQVDESGDRFTLRKTPAHNEQLVSVILLTRHGARTPLHIISNIEEVYCAN
jgi:hypothetical protein